MPSCPHYQERTPKTRELSIVNRRKPESLPKNNTQTIALTTSYVGFVVQASREAQTDRNYTVFRRLHEARDFCLRPRPSS